MPTAPSASTGAKSPTGIKGRVRKPFRTNTHCTDCKRELRKSEAAVCDECQMTKLGWKRG